MSTCIGNFEIAVIIFSVILAVFNGYALGRYWERRENDLMRKVWGNNYNG